MSHFDHVYCSTHLDDLVQSEIKFFNDCEWPEVSIWGVSEFMAAMKDYLKTNMHCRHKDIMEFIQKAETATNYNEADYYQTAALDAMLGDPKAREYMDGLYENALRTNHKAVNKHMEESKLYGSMSLMYSDFFDMHLATETPRLTEYVDISKEKETQKISKTIFLAATIDMFLDECHVEENDTYTLGRLHVGDHGDPYLTLLVYKADGTTEEHTLVPLKWLRNAVANAPAIKQMISAEEVNDFYREGLWSK